MTCDKSFIVSTEHMSLDLLENSNLFWDDTKKASDHFPVVADFIIEFSDEYIQNNIGNNEIECFNYNINLIQGWNLIGFGCESNVDAQLAFLPIIQNLIIAKDGLEMFIYPNGILIA